MQNVLNNNQHRPSAKTASLLLVRPEGFILGWRGATTRILDLRHGLTEHGWHIVMLAARATGVDQTPQETAFRSPILRTPFTGLYPDWIDRRAGLHRLYRGLWKLRGDACYHRRLELGWAARAVPWVKKFWRSEPPDVVWAICTQNINGLVAGLGLARHFSVPLVLEFHDPPSSSGHDDLHPILRPVFAECLQNSDLAITTTQAYASRLAEEYELHPERVIPVHLSYQGTCQQRQIGNTDDLVFLHAGSLHGGSARNARSLVEALLLVVERQPACRGHIRVRLLGGGQGAAEAAGMAKAKGLSDMVECCPELPFEQAKQEMLAADVLVVIKYADSRYDVQIPGKLFQYLGTGKPILGIMRETTEAAEILRRSGVGIIAPNDKPQIIADRIERLWQERSHLAETYRPDTCYVSQFSVENMTRRVHTILTTLVNKR